MQIAKKTMELIRSRCKRIVEMFARLYCAQMRGGWCGSIEPNPFSSPSFPPQQFEFEIYARIFFNPNKFYESRIIDPSSHRLSSFSLYVIEIYSHSFGTISGISSKSERVRGAKNFRKFSYDRSPLTARVCHRPRRKKKRCLLGRPRYLLSMLTLQHVRSKTLPTFHLKVTSS